MDNLVISDVKITPMNNSMYIKPCSLEFQQNGKRRKWDFIQVQNSVVIIIFNVTRQVLVLVKQFRPPIYFCSVPNDDKKDGVIDTLKHSPKCGISLEFCAGIVDKNKAVSDIAKEEVLEECGYDVPVQSLQNFINLRVGVSTQGAFSSFFYVEVTDAMKVNQGGGLIDEGEVIEVVEMSIPEVEKFVNEPDSIASADFMYGLLWFLKNKACKP